MASVLQTLGLGPPNPAAYSDASAVASQQTAAIGGLQSTVASVDTAFSVAKGTGVSSTTLDALQGLTTKGNTLMSQASTMDPATLAAKTATLQSDLMVTQFKALNEEYQKTLTDTKTIAAKIEARVKVVRTDSAISKDLLSQYESLLTDVNDSIKLLTASPPAYTVTPSSGSSGGSVSSYVVPTVPTLDEYQSRLDTLDGLKEREEGTGYTFPRMWRIFKRWCYVYLYKTLLVLFLISCFIFGGIIASNAYISSDPLYMPNRLFYFFYGALAFPITILSACIKPPFWVAGLFPAYIRDTPESTQTPLQGGGLWSIPRYTPPAKSPTPRIVAPPVAADSTTGILASSVTKTLIDARVIPASSVPSVTIGPSNRERAAVAKPVVVKAAPTLFTESGTRTSKPASHDMFSYVLVDPANPPEYQVKGKQTLWYVSIAHAVGLIAFGVSYGFLDKLSAGL